MTEPPSILSEIAPVFRMTNYAPTAPLCAPGFASRKSPPLLAIEIPIRLRQTLITVRCPIFLPLCRETGRSIDSIK